MNRREFLRVAAAATMAPSLSAPTIAGPMIAPRLYVGFGRSDEDPDIEWIRIYSNDELETRRASFRLLGEQIEAAGCEAPFTCRIRR